MYRFTIHLLAAFLCLSVFQQTVLVNAGTAEDQSPSLLVNKCKRNEYLDNRTSTCRRVPGGGNFISVNQTENCTQQKIWSSKSSIYYHVCVPPHVITARCPTMFTFKGQNCTSKPRAQTCTESGLFAVVNNCKSYYNCSSGNRTRTNKIMQCPQGQTFSEVLKQCTNDNKKCPDYPTNSFNKISIPKGFPQCQEPGRFRVQYNCSYFYVCIEPIDGTYTQLRLRCPRGLIHDNGVCVKGDNQTCIPEAKEQDQNITLLEENTIKTTTVEEEINYESVLTTTLIIEGFEQETELTTLGSADIETTELPEDEVATTDESSTTDASKDQTDQDNTTEAPSGNATNEEEVNYEKVLTTTLNDENYENEIESTTYGSDEITTTELPEDEVGTTDESSTTDASKDQTDQDNTTEAPTTTDDPRVNETSISSTTSSAIATVLGSTTADPDDESIFCRFNESELIIADHEGPEKFIVHLELLNYKDSKKTCAIEGGKLYILEEFPHLEYCLTSRYHESHFWIDAYSDEHKVSQPSEECFAVSFSPDFRGYDVDWEAPPPCTALNSFLCVN